MPAATVRSCPFCAHDRVQVHQLEDQPGDAYAVWCEECDTHGPVDTSEVAAVFKWNMRYGHEAPSTLE